MKATGVLPVAADQSLDVARTSGHPKGLMAMRSLRNFLFPVFIVLGVMGCASVPLLTALRLSSWTPQSLAQIDPAQVRVRLSVSPGYALDVPRSRLTLSLENARSSRTAEMPLTLLRASRDTRPGGIFSPEQPVTTYELALAPKGASELRVAQQWLLTNSQGSYEFSVNAPLSETPEKPEQIAFWADLKFSQQDAYMPLIDGATIQLEPRADR